MERTTMHRRQFLTSSLGLVGLGASNLVLGAVRSPLSYKDLKAIGPLGRANEVGLRLPRGFTGRLVAQAGQEVMRGDGTGTGYIWHPYPDGGACFQTADEGWIYVSNSEIEQTGGAGALRFNRDGSIADAYSILANTNRNCAGGPTPWGTWLSCEETRFGSVFECDISGKTPGEIRPGLGRFRHEAAAVDLKNWCVYLTEDEEDGCFYRYVPARYLGSELMDLDHGTLQVASVDTLGKVTWLAVPNPLPHSKSEVPTRKQVKEATIFQGGEGLWYHEGLVYLTTKHDNRVWAYDTKSEVISVLYDRKIASDKTLKGVDNVTVSSDGHILVAEDGGDMQIVILGPYGDIYPIVQVHGQDHSEMTGPSISPDGTRLYFSSQRGPHAWSKGQTFEITGKFNGLGKLRRTSDKAAG